MLLRHLELAALHVSCSLVASYLVPGQQLRGIRAGFSPVRSNVLSTAMLQ